MVLCNEKDCEKQAVYGYRKDDETLYCKKKHSKELMWDVKSTLCKEDGCKTT